jgi:hypothetical protein
MAQELINWLNALDIMGDKGWFEMSFEQAKEELFRRGYVHYFEIFVRIDSKIDLSFGSDRDFSPWTTFSSGVEQRITTNGIRFKLRVGYFFTDPADAVYARLVVG